MPRKTAWLAGAVLALTAALALGGCANLKPVASYGNKGAEVIGQNHQYIKELATSAGKQADYLRRVAVIKNLVDGVAKPWEETTQDPGLNQLLTAQRDLVEKRKKLVQGILALNEVLLKYHQGVAKLAADAAAPSADSVTGLTDKALSLLGDELASDDKTALSKLSALVVRGLTSEYRRERLAHLVAEAQPDVTRLLHKEAALLQGQYAVSLDTQRNMLNLYLARLVDVADPNPSDQTAGFRNLAQAIYWDRMLSENQELEQRKVQAGLLAQALEQLATCHQKLVAFAQDTHSPDLEKALSSCQECLQNKLDERPCK